MKTAVPKPRLGTRGQPEQTRAAILDAALKEFAMEGIAGARTDAIARAAGVNKALLYYYFQDKEMLYGAALDHVFGGLAERIANALRPELTPREKILAYARAHFDYVAENPVYPRMVQREMMRAGSAASPHIGSPHIRQMVERYFKPIFMRLSQILREGIEAGEFRPVNPAHYIPSMIAIIVFYFINTPVVRLIVPGDPLAPERIAERRAAVLDFIAASLFRGPETAAASEERPS
jgi:TetR/AcrR family transcriptional regulator